MNEAQSATEEVITVCRTCGFARYWETDEFEPGPDGKDLAADHYHEMEEKREKTHTVASIVPSDDLDTDQFPLIGEILEDFDPGEETIMFVDRDQLWEEVKGTLEEDDE